LYQVQKEREQRLAEIDMLESHIMQAQARSASADIRTTKRLYSDWLTSHPDVFIPPGMDHHMIRFFLLAYCLLDTKVHRFDIIGDHSELVQGSSLSFPVIACDCIRFLVNTVQYLVSVWKRY